MKLFGAVIFYTFDFSLNSLGYDHYCYIYCLASNFVLNCELLAGVGFLICEFILLAIQSKGNATIHAFKEC